MTSRPFATRLPGELLAKLELVCKRQGLVKSHVVEEALRERIEDLLDAEDLRTAVREATGFVPWQAVKPDARTPRRAATGSR